MKYQLLVSTMNRNDISFLEDMNVKSNTIVVNQSDHFDYEKVSGGSYDIEMYSFAERGVGLSRNTALMRATADIVEFADDDMVFVDNYEEIVVREFEMHPEADAILFSIDSLNPDRPSHRIDRFKRVNRFQGIKYGCARLAVRRSKLLYNNISFSLLFGGGTKYSAGEDTIFISDMIKAGMKVCISPQKVADVKQESSSWFNGFTDKFFKDKGSLIEAAFPSLSKILAVLLAVKNRRKYNTTFGHLYKLYTAGMKEYRMKK